MCMHTYMSASLKTDTPSTKSYFSKEMPTPTSALLAPSLKIQVRRNKPKPQNWVVEEYDFWWAMSTQPKFLISLVEKLIKKLT